ncbi:pilus assembly protein CpaC [Orbus hercynius]|uniref:Pilus assembly protein CpaC n=1 Tax=Orbus hercynius TaxID=593135 RepID=A0A495RKN3_9GAMM|nr:pilus assembly protein N-terminal domain-containing protein [Orbus hercynius]RKS87860.1 pilus assembly protein CpaC [Orbus hercynius]
MCNKIKKIAISICRLLVYLSPLCLFSVSQANVYNLQVGQSQVIALPEKVRTVFISQDSIANYEIIGDKSLIIYAKKNGSTNLLVYDENDRVIINDTINVDPLLAQITSRLAQNFPNSHVTIERYMGDESAGSFVYVLGGSVPDTTTKQRILDLVGAAVGIDNERIRTTYQSSDSGINENLLTFLDYRVHRNIIDNIRVIEEYQVNVKLTFVEVSKEFTDSLGIEWRGLSLTTLIQGGSAVNSLGEFSLIGLKKGFDIDNITTVIRAIKSDRLAKVLAEPNLSVLSGESASFLVGGEIPIVSSNKDGDSNVTYKEYGIKLNVSTKVNNDKRIRLFITNEFSSVSGNYEFNEYSIPTLSTRKTSSTIDLADGDSFVIAGLISEQDEEKLSRVPFIGDIPILGALARSSSTTRSKSEMVVFATVNLISPKNSFDGVKLPVFERTDVVNSFFNINNNMNKQINKSIPISNESETFINYMGFIE